MVFCSASVLLQLSLLLGNKARACLRTVQTPPGTRIPPCGQCVSNSYYPTDHCANPGGCIVIPPDQVTKDIITPAGCKTTTVTCPPDSLVHLQLKGIAMETTWDAFMMSSGGFDKFLCDDFGKWYAIFTDANGELDRFYCYRLGCASCPDIPISTVCPQGKTCDNPITMYMPAIPGQGDECRKVIIMCPPGTNSVFFEFNTGDSRSYPVGDLAGLNINCNREASWSLTEAANQRQIVSMRCTN